MKNISLKNAIIFFVFTTFSGSFLSPMVIGNYPALQNKDSTYIIEDENYISIFCCLT